MSKAFDTLSHHILLDKLDHIGVKGVPLKHSNNYLSNRTQSIYCNGNFSDFKYITTGVPLDSILGTILFLIYINDIRNTTTKFKFTIYVDDTAFLLPDKDIITLQNNLSTDL